MAWCTLDNFLGVVGEELTERGFLRPFESVKQLLDLGGHSAAHRNSYKQWESDEGQQHQAGTHITATEEHRHLIRLLISNPAVLHPIL